VGAEAARCSEACRGVGVDRLADSGNSESVRAGREEPVGAVFGPGVAEDAEEGVRLLFYLAQSI